METKEQRQALIETINDVIAEDFNYWGATPDCYLFRRSITDDEYWMFAVQKENLGMCGLTVFHDTEVLDSRMFDVAKYTDTLRAKGFKL